MELCETIDCTGCLSCFNTCKCSAIELYKDSEGFIFPRIIKAKCTECGCCVLSCPILTPQVKSGSNKKVYACWHRDPIIRRNSSSGGFFTAAAEKTLLTNGNKAVVFGASFADDYSIKHISVSSSDELYKLRGSKYVQSFIGKSFIDVEKALKRGENVLFTGTPCQVAGLNSHLKKDYRNLITLDLVCHGVPSTDIFKSYLRYLEDKFNSDLENFSFRDKKWSWHNYNTLASFKNSKQYVGTWQEDPFMRGFLREYFLRRSCHRCRFANLNRPGDITIADFWGVFSLENNKEIDKGISLIIVNNQKGESFFDSCRESLSSFTSDVNEALKGNKALSSYFPESPYRENFWKDYNIAQRKFTKELINRYMYPEKIPLRLKFLYILGGNNPLYHIASLTWRFFKFLTHKGK